MISDLLCSRCGAGLTTTARNGVCWNCVGRELVSAESAASYETHAPAPITDTGGKSLQLAEELLPLVYAELRKLAAQKMAGQAAGHTLQPTALVHEVWLRLSANGAAKFSGQTHFFAAAAQAMRHILIDAAKRKQSLRHGGELKRVNVADVQIASIAEDEELLAVHEAIDRLAAEAPQKAELAKLRYFTGLTFEEAAEVMGISVPTAKRYWAYARAWLYTEIKAKQAG